jgi:protein associated with RNAse G/E
MDIYTIKEITGTSGINYKEYYLNDKLHREFGPASKHGGTTYWFKNGIIHRENGPAIEYKEGKKVWIKNGKMHREDGPAVTFFSSEEWFIEGVKVDKDDFLNSLIKYKMKGYERISKDKMSQVL